MGRVKLEMKRIENSVSRKISFTKRRNGLMKKAFELSVLCGVDVAVITFSLTGKLRIFSGNNKSMEEIIERFLNTPNYEGRMLENREYLSKVVHDKLKAIEGNESVDYMIHQNASPDLRANMSKPDDQVEELQQEIIACKDQLKGLKKRLSFFESDPSEITTLSDAHICEYVLKDTLKRVLFRKRTLEVEDNHLQALNVIPQVQIPLYHDLISINNSSGGTFKKNIMNFNSSGAGTFKNNMNFLKPPNLIPSDQQFLCLDNTQIQPQAPFFYKQNLGKFITSDGDELLHHNAPQFRQNMEFNPSICPEFDTTGNNENTTCSTSQVEKTTKDMFTELFG